MGSTQPLSLPSRSVYWDYAMTIRLEEIVYLHCHQQGKRATGHCSASLHSPVSCIPWSLSHEAPTSSSTMVVPAVQSLCPPRHMARAPGVLSSSGGVGRGELCLLVLKAPCLLLLTLATPLVASSFLLLTVDSGGTVVLVSQDGIQRPPLRFPRGGHLLQFLSCLENGLLPHGQLDPPLWSQRGKVRCPERRLGPCCCIVARIPTAASSDRIPPIGYLLVPTGESLSKAEKAQPPSIGRVHVRQGG